jgi:hypothetical protein
MISVWRAVNGDVITALCGDRVHVLVISLPIHNSWSQTARLFFKRIFGGDAFNTMPRAPNCSAEATANG